MTPGFAVTNYKVPRATFQIVVFDLHKKFNSKNEGLYKKFCFTYI